MVRYGVRSASGVSKVSVQSGIDIHGGGASGISEVFCKLGAQVGVAAKVGKE